MTNRVNLLDCTLRDGGFINNWKFTYEGINNILQQLSLTGIEMIEIGLLKGDEYDPDRTLFPGTDECKNVLKDKNPEVTYFAMLDLSAPIPMERIKPRTADTVDGIRVIFKKNKINEAYEYCKYIKEQGYLFTANFVGTDQYTDMEFIEGIQKYNILKPTGMCIVDTFGLIKRKQFMRLCSIADNNMDEGIDLCYHAHNNMQQAFGNAEALLEMNLQRNVNIDCCVFGMGRGAGNLNLELFAQHMNDNYGTSYRIEPMLKIMDEYLTDFYKVKQWGYSLPYYISARLGCHPNYATYFDEKGTLTERAMHELIKSISYEDKQIYNKDKAEQYYQQYLNNYVDDTADMDKLKDELRGKKILLLAPGGSLARNEDAIKKLYAENEDMIIVSVNFTADDFGLAPDYVFSSNMRRYSKMKGKTTAKCIVTSNMKEDGDFVINFASYSLPEEIIIDNSGLMLMGILRDTGVSEILVAGMDGYSTDEKMNYYSNNLNHDFSKEAESRNALIKKHIDELKKSVKITFVTPSQYA